MRKLLIATAILGIAATANAKRIPEYDTIGSAASGDYLLISDTNASGREYKVALSALLTAIGAQAADSDLTTWAGVSSSANGRSLVSAADYAAMRTLLDLEVGIDFNAYDADIADLADGSLTGTKIGFADTDSLFTATNVDAALSELNDSINTGSPNGTGAKVHWSQLLGVPAGFADGTDAEGSGGGISHATSDGAYYASKDGAWASLTGIFASPLGSDDNYVTDAEKVVIGNTSGTNTGDQTTITGNAGTATALAANGTNCSAGQAPLGIDASGNAEGCWTPGGGSAAEDTAYNISTWNGDTDAPSKNVVRDYLYNFDADGDGSFTDETWFPSTSGAPTSATYLTTTAEAGLSAEANLGALTTGLMKITVAAGTATPSTAVAGTDYQAPLVAGTNYLRPTTDVDDTPVNGETAQPVSSNWAADHLTAVDPHTVYMLESNIGTGANNYVQLNASSQLPAVSAALLTNFPTFNQNTTGTAGGLSGTPNITVGTISAGATGFAVDADGDVTAKSYLTSAADGSRYTIIPNNTTIAPLADGSEQIYNEGGALKAVENDTEYDIMLSRDIGSAIQAYDADLTTWAGVTPGTGVGTFLATPSSANLRSAVTDESGTGALLFAGGDIAAGTATTPSANDNDTSVATTAYVQTELTGYASDTVTLTNKTLNVESTGNAVTIVDKVWFAAAGCNNTTATSFYDLPTSNPGAAACITGTNTQKGVLDFDAATDESGQVSIALPSDWSGNIDLKYKWLAAATSGSVVWGVQTSCVADAETDDPSWNTASTVTDAAKGTTLQTNDASMTTITVTGCAAGELMHLRLFRDADNGSDTMTGDARLIGAELTLRRAQ